MLVSLSLGCAKLLENLEFYHKVNLTSLSGVYRRSKIVYSVGIAGLMLGGDSVAEPVGLLSP
jgi:hypothetical protein